MLCFGGFGRASRRGEGDTPQSLPLGGITPSRYTYTIALNIKNQQAERLAAEVAALAGETKTRAVTVALEERRERLALRGARNERGAMLRRFLEDEAWPQVPAAVLGKPLSREEREAILGYGPSGV